MNLWQKSISAVETAFQESRLRVTGRTMGALMTSAVAVSGLSGCAADAVWNMPLPNAAPPTIYVVPLGQGNQPPSHCDGRFAVRDSANCHQQDWQDAQRRQQEQIQRERQEERARHGWQGVPAPQYPSQQYAPPPHQQTTSPQQRPSQQTVPQRAPQQQRQEQQTVPPQYTQQPRQPTAPQPYMPQQQQFLPGQR